MKKFISILIMFVFLTICSYILFSGLAAFSKMDIGLFNIAKWNDAGRLFFGIFTMLLFAFSAAFHLEHRV